MSELVAAADAGAGGNCGLVRPSFVLASSAAISSALSKRCVVGDEPRSIVEPSRGTLLSDGAAGKNGCCSNGPTGVETSTLKFHCLNVRLGIRL